MLQPYKDKEKKMTDGIYAVSKMLGDVKFHRHQGIDSSVADQWKEHYTEDFLGEITWQLAESLGYERRISPQMAAHLNRNKDDSTERINEAAHEEMLRLLAEVEGLSDDEAKRLLADERE